LVIVNRAHTGLRLFGLFAHADGAHHQGTQC
jgi:hypothetical protein